MEEEVKTTEEVEQTEDIEPNDEEMVDEETESTENESEVEEDETSEEDSNDSQEELDKPEYTKKQVEKMMKKRLGSMSNSYKRKEERLLSVLKAGGFEGKNLDELTDELISNYKEEGIDIPEYKYEASDLSEREQEALAKLDAEDIIEMGPLAMEDRFAELYEKENRTLREEKEMELIGREASLKEAKKEIVKAGYSPEELLGNKEFMDFAKKMSSDVPVNEIIKYYEKLTGALPTKPKSTGSIKSKGGSGKVKDFYTPEEAREFTRKQLDDNPALFKAIEKSMEKW